MHDSGAPPRQSCNSKRKFQTQSNLFTLRLFEKLGFTATDEFDNLGQTSGKLGEILFVEKNLMPVVGTASIGIAQLAALGDRDEIIVSARSLHIEKIGPTSGFHGFRHDPVAAILAVRVQF